MPMFATATLETAHGHNTTASMSVVPLRKAGRVVAG
jgi:hypothetical protein